VLEWLSKWIVCRHNASKIHPILSGLVPFLFERLLRHVDPGTAKESEDFVRRIYEQRHIDLSSKRDGKTGR